ncbi:MAG: nicotinate (nicotinamide) nucleotide adenylyltransferase [Candidatus Hydrogenedentota bacterium]|nr:MAG: nicotinate (nicotinamide) nucleotide adenylyltransferase [Candidatus Hydrogenedentota bacterium]
MNEPERIGVLGGTFDPIHNAHLDLALAALESANLDRVIFVVAARPPHKTGDIIATAEQRLDMVRAAVGDNPKLEVSDVEIRRAGPSYTADTLDELQEAYPGARLHLIMGMDSLVDLPRWREPKRILDRAHLLAAHRDSNHVGIPSELAGHYDLIPFELAPVSSTVLREKLSRGEDVSGVLPQNVLDVVKLDHIYGA